MPRRVACKPCTARPLQRHTIGVIPFFFQDKILEFQDCEIWQLSWKKSWKNEKSWKNNLGKTGGRRPPPPVPRSWVKVRKRPQAAASAVSYGEKAAVGRFLNQPLHKRTVRAPSNSESLVITRRLHVVKYAESLAPGAHPKKSSAFARCDVLGLCPLSNCENGAFTPLSRAEGARKFFQDNV